MTLFHTEQPPDCVSALPGGEGVIAVATYAYDEAARTRQGGIALYRPADGHTA